MNEQTRQFIAERNVAFENDDIEFSRKLCPGASDRAVEILFHKARYVCLDASREKRLDSQKWLALRGIKIEDKLVYITRPLPL